MVPAILVGLVAVIHVAISVVEIFLWRSPKVHGRLGYDAQEAAKVAPIVANAGLYNGFLAVGLFWSLTQWGGTPSQILFLSFSIVAGIFGALTLKWTTLVLQTLPALVAFASVADIL